jgi:lipid II:glycine glycyltransferase (peptidoglycan interpeptide bridge formation enzyme)
MKIEPLELTSLSADNSIFQSHWWATVKQKTNWIPYAFSYTEDQSEGTFLVLVKKTPFNYFIAYTPFFTVPNKEFDLKLLASLIKERLPKKTLFCRFDLNWNSFYKKSEYAGYSPQPLTTLIIDLREGYEAVVKRYRKRVVRHLTKAKTQNIKIEEFAANSFQFTQWYEIYKDEMQRRKIPARSFSYLEHLLKSKENKTKGSLFIATKDDEVVGGIIVASNQNEAIYLFGSSLKEYAAAYLLQDYAIQYCCKNKIAFYNLFGISGDDKKSQDLKNLDLFKSGFGGKLYKREEAIDFPYHKFLYHLFRFAEKLRVLSRKVL